MRASLLLLVLVVGCGSPTTTTSGQTASSSTGGSSLYGGGLCDMCDRTSCADERATCAAEPECAAYLDCLDKCPTSANGDADATCDVGCRTVTDPAAEAALSVFDSCRVSGAGVACADCGRTGSGGAGGGGATCTMPAIVTSQQCQPMPGDACIQCQYDKCCDSVHAVFDGTGPAEQLGNCYLACPKDDSACVSACYAKYPDGVPDFAGYEACLFENCLATGLCKQSSSDKCGLCEYQQCGCEFARCTVDKQCFLANDCFAKCTLGDNNCAKACIAQYPTSKPLLNALEVCMVERCIDTCAGN